MTRASPIRHRAESFKGGRSRSGLTSISGVRPAGAATDMVSCRGGARLREDGGVITGWSDSNYAAVATAQTCTPGTDNVGPDALRELSACSGRHAVHEQSRALSIDAFVGDSYRTRSSVPECRKSLISSGVSVGNNCSMASDARRNRAVVSPPSKAGVSR